MKTMTCKQLGGACDLPLRAQTFEEIAQLSKAHGMEMADKGDAAHLQAMKNMRLLMENPADLEQWMGERKKKFDTLSSDL